MTRQESMNSNIHKQFVQTVKNQNNKIKSLEIELSQHKVDIKNLDSIQKISNSRIKELEEKDIALTNELKTASKQVELANHKINELNKEVVEKSAELESARHKINEMTSDLDKRNDAIYQIDKIILRNNDYFDEVKKELNNKIACSKEMTELYQNTNNELLRVRNEMELLCKELDETKRELQLYKNDFILKSATF